MLKKFSVKGFKNFGEKIELNLSNIREYKFNPQCITDGLISKAIIYGKNSVGKTKFFIADVIMYRDTECGCVYFPRENTIPRESVTVKSVCTMRHIQNKSDTWKEAVFLP